jgi:hypothetical protein
MQMKTATLVSKTYDVDDFAAAQEFYHSNGGTLTSITQRCCGQSWCKSTT